MNKQQAIAILKKQQERLNQETDYRNVSWKTHTMSLIKDFFGEDSVEYKKIANKSFWLTTQHVGEWGVYDTYEIDKRFFNSYLDNCVEKIQIKGLYKEPKKGNFISRISEGWMIFWVGLFLITILPSIFMLGYKWKSLFLTSIKEDTTKNTTKAPNKVRN